MESPSRRITITFCLLFLLLSPIISARSMSKDHFWPSLAPIKLPISKHNQEELLQAIGKKVQSNLEEITLINEIKSAFARAWMTEAPPKRPKKLRHLGLYLKRDAIKGDSLILPKHWRKYMRLW